MSLLLLCFVVIGNIVNGQLNLILLPNNTAGAQCMDGSPAGLYYSPPPSGSSNLWVIAIKGGGGCHTKGSCDQRANTSSGSSNYWLKTLNNLAHFGELSNNKSINPDFYTGHKLYCYYCSSDAWSGQRTKPSQDPDTWGYIFGGHLIFTNIIQYAEDNLGLLDAQYVLVTGNSAGGLGLFGNIDWLYNELKEKAKYKNLTFKGSPRAGWFFPGNTTDQLNNPMMPPNDYPHWMEHTNGGTGHEPDDLYDSYLNPKCVEDLGANLSWHCDSVHNVYKYIETPLFVMEQKFDQNQIYTQFLLPKNTVNDNTKGFVEYFGVDMDRSIITQMIDEQNPNNGLFYCSCFDHGPGLGIGNSAPLTYIGEYNSSELVGDWFWERNKLPHFVYDKCNNDTYKLPCNPTCDSYPPKNK